MTVTVRQHPATDYGSVVNDSAQLLDVRQPDEVAGGTLPGALNIPLDELPTRLSELDRSRRTVALCRSGGRSAQAAELLTSVGFTDVVNLQGGMLALDDAR